MAPEQYDALIIGVGQAGNPLSTALTDAGWRVAVIERRYVGGTCINDGCTPTKTLIASGHMAYQARRAESYGIQVRELHVDWPAVRARKQDLVESWRESIRQRIQRAEGAELLFGEARFVAPKGVEVALREGGTRQLTAETIFINTGGRPAMPPIPGLDEVPTLDSTTIMEVASLPEHLLVLGGGYIGLEFGQLFRRLGSEVTIIQRAPRLIPREDPEISEAVAEILREEGIELVLDAETTQARQRDDGPLELSVRTPEGERQLVGSQLLVAAGRRPNTEALNLAAAGVEVDGRGYIQVNERLETSVAGIYALGDVKGGPAFTHIAYDDYRIVAENLLRDGQRTIHDRPIPYTLFTDPQLGRVGLSEQEARAQGREIRVATLPMSHVARAVEVGQDRGFMKAVVDAHDGQILGVAVLGLEGGELMSMLQIAMMGRVPYSALRDAVFAHPTLAESLNNLFLSLE